MEKNKLISLKKAIKSAFKNLFENTSLGFTYKAVLSFSLISGALGLILVVLNMIIFYSTYGEFYNNNPSKNKDIIIENQVPSNPSTPPVFEDFPPPQDPLTPPVQINTTAMTIFSLVGGLMSVAIGIIFTTFSSLIPLKVHSKKLPAIKDLLLESIRKAPKFILLSLIVSVTASIGYILLIIPGIIISIWFLFSPYILLKEDTGIIGAMKRSKELTKGYRWGLFFRGLLFILLALILAIPLLIVTYISLGMMLPILMVFTPLVLLKFYEDLKSKKYGNEIQEKSTSPSPESENEKGKLEPEKEESPSQTNPRGSGGIKKSLMGNLQSTLKGKTTGKNAGKAEERKPRVEEPIINTNPFEGEGDVEKGEKVLNLAQKQDEERAEDSQENYEERPAEKSVEEETNEQEPKKGPKINIPDQFPEDMETSPRTGEQTQQQEEPNQETEPNNE